MAKSTKAKSTPRSLLVLIAAAWLATAPPDPAPAVAAAAEPTEADDLLIVDCLLPAKVRRLGRRRTYLAPRRPLRTTAVDCRIRGGDYAEPDQANYATALKVWLPRGNEGEAEAQYYIGQIFEKGLGVAPDYASAASWYEKAADQGHAAAQVSLGYLYEEGLGVERDEVRALNWYRQAAGLSEDLVVLGEADYAELVAAQEELVRRTDELDSLQREVDELRRQLEEFEARTEEEQTRRRTLESLKERLERSLAEREAEVEESRDKIATLEKSLAAAAAPAARSAAEAVGEAVRSELEFGRYRALVIGNSAYRDLPSIETAASDARSVAELLRDRYNFEVELLIDASRYDIMSALNGLRQDLTEEDNLLVYYAGHGRRQGETAYWQPVDADADNPANWIPSEVVTEHLDLVPAKHLFLVADSVYSGLRTRSSIARLPVGMTEEERFFHIRLLLEKRSRLVLTSGEERPAAGDAGSSRFSSALLRVLRENDGVLEASRVYQALTDRLAGDASVPEFAPMRWARNNVSDFFFVARSR